MSAVDDMERPKMAGEFELLPVPVPTPSMPVALLMLLMMVEEGGTITSDDFTRELLPLLLLFEYGTRLNSNDDVLGVCKRDELPTPTLVLPPPLLMMVGGLNG